MKRSASELSLCIFRQAYGSSAAAVQRPLPALSGIEVVSALPAAELAPRWPQGLMDGERSSARFPMTNSGEALEHELNRLVLAATRPWIMILGAAEALAEPDLDRLLALLEHPARPCYLLPILHGAGSRGILSVRLFPRDAELLFLHGFRDTRIAPGSKQWCAPFVCNVPIASSLDPQMALEPTDRRILGQQVAKARVDRHPQDWHAHEALGLEFLRAGEAASAIAPLERAAALHPNHILILNALAYAKMESGALADAQAIWEHTLRINPEFHLAWLNIGVIQLRQNLLPEAERCLQRSLQLLPDDPLANYNIAVVYTGLGQAERAERYLRVAVQSDSFYIQALADLGANLMRQGRAGEAEEFLRRALQREPRHFTALFNLGALLMAATRETEALAVWREWVRAYPQAPQVEGLLQRYPQLSNVVNEGTL